jgi:hypothetical protein
MKKSCAGDAVKDTESRIIDTQKDMEQKRELGRLGSISSKRNETNIDLAVRSEGDSRQCQILTEEDREKLNNFETETKRTSAIYAAPGLRIGRGLNLAWEAGPSNLPAKSLLSYDEF